MPLPSTMISGSRVNVFIWLKSTITRFASERRRCARSTDVSVEAMHGSVLGSTKLVKQRGAVRLGSMTDVKIEYSSVLGRRVRKGPWEDQAVSTYRKIREAIEEGRPDDAAQLLDYFLDEAQVCFAIYRQWIPDLSAFL